MAVSGGHGSVTSKLIDAGANLDLLDDVRIIYCHFNEGCSQPLLNVLYITSVFASQEGWSVKKHASSNGHNNLLKLLTTKREGTEHNSRID